MAVHVALNELNKEFELINSSASKEKTRSAEFLEANPRGSVPVLKIDNFVLREGAAILTYLLDNHENDLLPKSGLERATALEWLAFANSTLHPAYGRIFFMMKNLEAGQVSANSLYKPTISQIQKYWDEIEDLLEKQEYLAGDKLTIGDILVTVIANWSGYFESKINFGAKTKAYFSKIISRPSYKKALEVEGVKYTANL